MRHIGTIADETEAKTFADFLLTQGITTRVDARPAGSEIWVHKEDLVPQARRELEAFRKDPADPRYRGADQAAREIRKQAEEAERRHRKNTVDLRGRLGRPNITRGPLTRGLLIASIAMGVLTALGENDPIVDLFTFTTYHVDRNNVPHSDGLEPILSGQVWRLITPIFLHFGAIHLIFNMFALNELGGVLERLKGTRLLALLVFVTAIVSNLAQFAFPSVFNINLRGIPNSPGDAYSLFGGMSGVVFGLFGYIWVAGRLDPTSGMALSQNSVFYMVGWLVICMLGMIGHVANTAHAVGLLVGMLFGAEPYLRNRFLR
jgi:GlpG protein